MIPRNQMSVELSQRENVVRLRMESNVIMHIVLQIFNLYEVAEQNCCSTRADSYRLRPFDELRVPHIAHRRQVKGNSHRWKSSCSKDITRKSNL